MREIVDVREDSTSKHPNYAKRFTMEVMPYVRVAKVYEQPFQNVNSIVKILVANHFIVVKATVSNGGCYVVDCEVLLGVSIDYLMAEILLAGINHSMHVSYSVALRLLGNKAEVIINFADLQNVVVNEHIVIQDERSIMSDCRINLKIVFLRAEDFVIINSQLYLVFKVSLDLPKMDLVDDHVT